MSRFYANKDRYRVTTEMERLCYAAGIPHRFWADTWYNLQPTPVFFKNFSKENVTLSTQTQQKWLGKMSLPDNQRKPFLTVMGGLDTDEPAMAMACRLVQGALLAGLKAQVFDLMETEDLPDERDDIVVIYNLSTRATTLERALASRDLTKRYADRFRILVVDGNPGEYAYEQLRLAPHGIIAFRGGLKSETTKKSY